MLDVEEIPSELLEEYVKEEFPHLLSNYPNFIEYLRRFGILDRHADVIRLDPIIARLYKEHVS